MKRVGPSNVRRSTDIGEGLSHSSAGVRQGVDGALRTEWMAMNDNDWLAEQFEQSRPHLRAVAFRVLGTQGDADDAVQEAWLRLSRTDADAIDNLGGWLTTVVSRVCLDMLRSRKSRREDPFEVEDAPEVHEAVGAVVDPEREVVQADAVGTALLVVLDTLSPAERLAFVLHDMFAVSFDDIAPIVDKSPAAARQLASRARRRVQGASAEPDLRRQRAVVDAFLAASREGRFEDLLQLLDPDVVLRADQVAVDAAHARGGNAPALAEVVRGRDAVMSAFAGRAQAARPAMVDGVVGAAWVPGGTPRAAFCITVRAGKVVAIEVLADPDTIHSLDVTLLDA